MTQRSSKQETAQPIQTAPSIFQVSTIVYGVMAIIGLILMQYAHRSTSSAFFQTANNFSPIVLACIGLLAGGKLLCVSYFFEEFFPSYRYCRSVMLRTLGRVSIPTGLYLAAVSAIGEEMFFRGGLQPFAGVLLTSALFGLMHIGPDGGVSSWSVWAGLAAIMLGWTYVATQSLWPAIIGHFMVNAYGILRLRSDFRRLQQNHSQAESKDAQTSS